MENKENDDQTILSVDDFEIFNKNKKSYDNLKSDTTLTDSDESNTCLICTISNEEDIILYQHDCGQYYVHSKCLNDWFMSKQNYECFVCRENIIKEDFDVNTTVPINNEEDIMSRPPSNVIQNNTLAPIIVPYNQPDRLFTRFLNNFFSWKCFGCLVLIGLIFLVFFKSY